MTIKHDIMGGKEMFAHGRRFKVLIAMSVVFFAGLMTFAPLAQAVWVNDSGRDFECTAVYSDICFGGASGEKIGPHDLAVLKDGSLIILHPGWKSIDAFAYEKDQTGYPSWENIWRSTFGM